MNTNVHFSILKINYNFFLSRGRKQFLTLPTSSNYFNLSFTMGEQMTATKVYQSTAPVGFIKPLRVHKCVFKMSSLVDFYLLWSYCPNVSLTVTSKVSLSCHIIWSVCHLAVLTCAIYSNNIIVRYIFQSQ